jgi:hypothetical protein
VDKAGKGSGLLDTLGAEIDAQLNCCPGNLVTSWDVSNWVVDQISGSRHATAFFTLEREYLIAVVLYRMKQ